MAKQKTATSITLAPLRKDAYMVRHVDIHLQGVQRQNLRRLMDTLIDSRAELANAKRVTSPTTALKWLLENLHDLPGVASDKSE